MSGKDDLSSAPAPGSIFAGKYRIERLLGAGGMGYVLAAVHLQLDERVAIKMLLPSMAQHAETVERFLREGRAAVKIKSEHVGRVLDVSSANDTPYIVMEYLDGVNLDELLARDKRLAPQVAVDYVLQACEAIAEAHALRIVHRDLKPANLFLVHKPDGTPVVKVLDFGISKMTAPEGAEQMSMTRTSSILGSPLYMSPEQLKSARVVDERSDIWSLGIIVFELLSGAPPFIAETIAELGALVLTGQAPDVRGPAPETPAGLAQAVARCLRTKADERFPSVAELAAAMAPHGSESARASAARITRVLQGIPRRPTASIPEGPDSSPRAFANTEALPTGAASSNTWGGATLSATDPEPGAKKRARPAGIVMIAGAVTALVAVVAGGSLLLRPHPAATATASAPPFPPTSAFAAVPALPSVAPSAVAASDPQPPPSTNAPVETAAPMPRGPTAAPPRSRPVVTAPSAVPSVTAPTPASTPAPAPTPTTSGFAHNRYE
jgi:serine/threonine-protein kinase